MEAPLDGGAPAKDGGGGGGGDDDDEDGREAEGYARTIEIIGGNFEPLKCIFRRLIFYGSRKFISVTMGVVVSCWIAFLSPF